MRMYLICACLYSWKISVLPCCSITIISPSPRNPIADGFTLADKDTQITFSPSQNNVTMLDLDSNKGLPRYIPLSEKSVQAYTLLIQSYPPDKKKEMCRDLLYAQLNRMDSVGASDLKKYIERIVER